MAKHTQRPGGANSMTFKPIQYEYFDWKPDQFRQTVEKTAGKLYDVLVKFHREGGRCDNLQKPILEELGWKDGKHGLIPDHEHYEWDGLWCKDKESKVALEIEWSRGEAILKDMVTFELGWKRKFIDAGVIVTLRGKPDRGKSNDDQSGGIAEVRAMRDARVISIPMALVILDDECARRQARP